MKSLALFRPSFQKMHKVIEQTALIKQKIMPNATKRPMLERLSRTMLIMNSIEHNAIDLQTREVEDELSKFNVFLKEREMSVSYDYEKRGFQMITNTPINHKINHISMQLKSHGVQKVDHPMLRQTLYFHELKNIEQIVKINYPRNSPRFIRDIYRRNVQNNLLDPENPLGVPFNAPPLEITIKFNDLFAIAFYCRYGYINMKWIQILKQEIDGQGQSTEKCDYILNGLNIPRPIQKIVYSLCKEQLKLDEPELLLLHKIAYIGGRVEQLEFLFNMFQFYTAPLDLS